MRGPRAGVLGVSKHTRDVWSSVEVFDPRPDINLVRFYQEFLAKSLTDKYTGLNLQMDKVIHNANSEISTLHSKLSGRSPRSL